MKIEDIIGDYKKFLEKIFINLKKSGIDQKDILELDHVAFRTETIERYEYVKKELQAFVLASSEKIFNGRLILILKLMEPLKYKEFVINCIELMAPKENNQHKEGLEHAEFVVGINLDDFLEKYKNISFNLSAYGREDNRELIIDFDDCAIKFHEQSLLKVRGID